MKKIAFFLLLNTVCHCFGLVKKEIEVREIVKNVYSFSPGGGGLNAKYSLFVVTCYGVIAIEPFDTKHATAFLAAIKRVTNQPIKWLLISHNHWDHASGGQVFKDAGANLLAHFEAVEWMKDNPKPDLLIPDRIWRGRRKNIRLGGATVELHFKGINHGNGMTIFLVRGPGGTAKDNVVYIADLVSPGAVLFGTIPDFNMKETERTLNEIIALDFEIGVFSHSSLKDPLGGGKKQDVKNILQLVVDIRTGVDDLLAKGTNPFLIPTTLKLRQYKDFARFETDLPQNIGKFTFERLIGPYPWRVVSDGLPKKNRRKFPRRNNRN